MKKLREKSVEGHRVLFREMEAANGADRRLRAVRPQSAVPSLFLLRAYEMRLRAPVDPDHEEDESSMIGDPLVARFRSRLFSIRLVLIWVFAGIVIVGIYGASLDPSRDLVTRGAR